MYFILLRKATFPRTRIRPFKMEKEVYLKLKSQIISRSKKCKNLGFFSLKDTISEINTSKFWNNKIPLIGTSNI